MENVFIFLFGESLGFLEIPESPHGLSGGLMESRAVCVDSGMGEQTVVLRSGLWNQGELGSGFGSAVNQLCVLRQRT